MKTKKTPAKAKGGTKGVIKAATDAAVELGAAAQDLQSSWAHVKNAQKRGKRAARPVMRAGKKVMKVASRTAKAAVKRVTGKGGSKKKVATKKRR